MGLKLPAEEHNSQNGCGWARLERIARDCIRENLKHARQFISVCECHYIMLYINYVCMYALKPTLLCGRDLQIKEVALTI